MQRAGWRRIAGGSCYRQAQLHQDARNSGEVWRPLCKCSGQAGGRAVGQHLGAQGRRRKTRCKWADGVVVEGRRCEGGGGGWGHGSGSSLSWPPWLTCHTKPYLGAMMRPMADTPFAEVTAAPSCAAAGDIQKLWERLVERL